MTHNGLLPKDPVSYSRNGQFINRGLALSDTKRILLGAIPAAILALIVDLSIGAFEWGLRPERKRDKKGSLTALMMPILLILAGMLSYFTRPYATRRLAIPLNNQTGTVRIATKNFTEQLILGEIMAQLIEAKTDLTVERRFNLGGTMVCHAAPVVREAILRLSGACRCLVAS